MTMMLGSDEEGDRKTKCGDIMLKSAGMSMFDQVINKFFIFIVYFFFVFPETNAGTINNSKISAHVFDKIDPTNSISI
tara:strand:+ start:1826 stop:2059 length:234 start_codon:yes stop_codon:yes gene_type:complete